MGRLCTLSSFLRTALRPLVKKNLEGQVEEGSFCAFPFLALFVGVWVELAGDPGPSGKGNSAEF